MGILIDTNIFIDVEKGRIDLKTHLRGRTQEESFISVITASELLHGVHRATDAKVRARRLAFIEGVLVEYPILKVDLATARSHARLWADLQANGMIIGAHDLWLATTCLAHGHTLATANVREFQRVPRLTIENWRSPSV